MTMAKIPQGILDKIRKKRFNFLYIVKSAKEGIHPCQMEETGYPKRSRRMGIKIYLPLQSSTANKTPLEVVL